MNLIITSEMRTGSRWLCSMLAELLDMKAAPEIDATKLKNICVRNHFYQNEIVKLHHAAFYHILTEVKPIDYKIVGIVRNPRDRLISESFHNRYHTSDYPFPQKAAKTDIEAIEYTVFEDIGAELANHNQLSLMVPGRSTCSLDIADSPYIWTSYEWLLEDCFSHVKAIINWLRISHIDETAIRACVEISSFKVLSGREPGDERRDDLWRRCGQAGQWREWDPLWLDRTASVHELYEAIIYAERQDD